MATRTVQASQVADSIKRLMAAMDDEIIPREEELRKAGWVTAMDYARSTDKSIKAAKSLLDNSSRIVKQQARTKFSKVMMYKAR